MASTVSQHDFDFGTDGSLALKAHPARFVVHSGYLDQESGKACGSALEGAPSKGSTFVSRLSRKAVLFVCLASVLVALMGARFVDIRNQERLAQAFGDVNVTSVYVEDGGSLWSYARHCSVKGATTQEVVDWIIAKNGMNNSTLMAGKRIQVPNYRG